MCLLCPLLSFPLYCASNDFDRVFFLSMKTRLHLKSRYKDRLNRVLDYVGEVKDFDELISPDSLSLHFLGPKPFGGVLQILEMNKRSQSIFPLLQISFL